MKRTVSGISIKIVEKHDNWKCDCVQRVPNGNWSFFPLRASVFRSSSKMYSYLNPSRWSKAKNDKQQFSREKHNQQMDGDVELSSRELAGRHLATTATAVVTRTAGAERRTAPLHQFRSPTPRSSTDVTFIHSPQGHLHCIQRFMRTIKTMLICMECEVVVTAAPNRTCSLCLLLRQYRGPARVTSSKKLRCTWSLQKLTRHYCANIRCACVACPLMRTKAGEKAENVHVLKSLEVVHRRGVRALNSIFAASKSSEWFFVVVEFKAKYCFQTTSRFEPIFAVFCTGHNKESLKKVCESQNVSSFSSSNERLDTRTTWIVNLHP